MIRQHNTRQYSRGMADVRLPSLRCWLAGVIGAFIVGLSWSVPSEADERRDKVKAVFLYKFFDYVTWESEHDPIKYPPAVICTLGDTAFEGTLRYVSKKKADTLRNYTKKVSNLKDTDECHILFISVPDVTHNLDRAPAHVLTVSDENQFAELGGMIELRDKQEKVQLIINLEAVRHARLKVSSKLLNIAEVIR